MVGIEKQSSQCHPKPKINLQLKLNGRRLAVRHSPSVWILWHEEGADDADDAPEDAEDDDRDGGGAHGRRRRRQLRLRGQQLRDCDDDGCCHFVKARALQTIREHINKL